MGRRRMGHDERRLNVGVTVAYSTAKLLDEYCEATAQVRSKVVEDAIIVYLMNHAVKEDDQDA